MHRVSETMDDFVKAIRSGDAEEVALMLSRSPALMSSHHADSFGATGLIHAVLSDDVAMVDLLLDAGADIDQRSDWWAGSFGVLDHSKDSMSTHLLERGATLTPHAAARLGMIDELRSMIAADPECVHRRGGDGQFPLHFARTPEIADLLLEHGAHIDARDLDHESTAAQWLATSRPAVAAHLVRRGCAVDPFLAAAAGVDALRDLVALDPDAVHATVSRDRFATTGERAAEHIYFYTIGEGCSVLHAAATANRGDVILWLIAGGADPNARGGYDEQTPLHAAAWNDAPKSARALVEGGADLNPRSGNIHRNEPLGWAIVGGSPSAVAALLELGATIRKAHLDDAEAGATGKFQAFSRDRALERWAEVRDQLRAVSSPLRAR
jgi:ankyrin repeat protein